MRLARFLLAFALASAVAAPAFAQFLISVQQNGQATSVANGGSVAMNAPAVGQTASATVTLTYLDATSVSFGSGPQILGSGDFTTDVISPVTLGPLSSTTFHIRFTPKDSALEVAQLTWPYTETPPTGSTALPAYGVVNLTLAGGAPNLTINTVKSDGTYLTVPAGGAFQFADTLVNSSSTLTVSIANTGSGSSKVNSITVTGGAFQPQAIPLLPFTLNANTELRFGIQFQPKTAGAQTGSLQISLGAGSYAATLSGNALAAILTYQITQGAKTSTLAPDQTIAMDDTKVGDKSSVVVQFKNAGSAAVVLNTVALSGAGFSFTDGPFLPLTMQPQQTNTLTLQYAPTQPGPSTGRLLIGNDAFPLAARALGPLFTYSYQAAGGSATSVNPGDLISFSPIAVGQTESLQFTVTNTGTTAGAIQSAGVTDTSGVFKTRSVAALPIQLSPNGTTTFTIDFAPKAEGLAVSTLVINNSTFAVAGFASPPPALPTYHFTGASGTVQPFQQPAIGISLDQSYPLDLTGILTITIASSSFAPDPAVQFSTGGRQVTFTMPANTLQAVFPSGSKTIQLQTGTVAGAIILTPQFALSTGDVITPGIPPALTLTVPPLAPAILSAAIGSRSATGFSVIVSGFSTTRYLDHIDFQFAAGGGFTLAATRVTVDVSSAARLWFLGANSQNAGGQFDVEVPFTLGSGASGTDLSKAIASVSVVVANDIGSSGSAQVVNQ